MKTLIKKAQHKGADAFVELMQENMKGMYKVARAILSNDEDAADAALAASMFHYGEVSVPQVKRYLKERGIAVRL